MAAPLELSPFSTRAAVTRSLAWSYVNWIAGFVAPLVLIPLYVRLLGHQLYGEWLVIMSLTSYLGLASLGSWQAVGNRIAEAAAQRRPTEVARFLSTGFFAYAAIVTAILIAVFVAAPFAWQRLMPSLQGVELAAFLIFVMFSAIAFPFRAHAILLRSLGRVDVEQTIAAIASVGRIIVMAAALIAGAKLLGVALIEGAVFVGSVLAAYLAAARLRPQARPRLEYFSWQTLRELVAPSAGFLGLTIAGTLAFGVDNLVIGYAIGAVGVTRYAVPFRLVTVVSGAFVTGVTALWPTITAYHATGQQNQLSAGFMLVMRVALLFAGACAILLWLCGPGFIRLWAGAGVFPDRATFGLQVALMIIQMLLIPADAILMATTRHYGYAALAMAEGLLNLALSLLWVRYWGLAGVIGATITARLITTGWYLPVTATRALGITGAQVARALGPAFALTVVALAAVEMFVVVRADSLGARELIIAAVCICAFVTAFGAVAFTRDERRAVVGIVSAGIARRRW